MKNMRFRGNKQTEEMENEGLEISVTMKRKSCGNNLMGGGGVTDVGTGRYEKR
jgi:hypothetical protein